jgi:hypothetical protein
MCVLAEREALCDHAAGLVCIVSFLYTLRCFSESFCEPTFSEQPYTICESIGVSRLSCGAGGTIRGPVQCDTSVRGKLATIILECRTVLVVEKHLRTTAHASPYVHSSMPFACFGWNNYSY